MKKLNNNSVVLFDALNVSKTSGLSNDAELLARRMLDLIWDIDNACFPNDKDKIFRAIGQGFSFKTFNVAWEDVQYQGFEVFDITDDGQFLHNKKITKKREVAAKLKEKRAKAGHAGGTQAGVNAAARKAQRKPARKRIVENQSAALKHFERTGKIKPGLFAELADEMQQPKRN